MTDEEPPRGVHILDAAVRLIANEGLSGLSIRAVANEAGVSLAQVQYYFRTKDDLVAAAFEHASAQFLTRLTAALERPRSVRRLRAAIALWLPLDDERERWVKVWLAFIGAAATRPELAEAARRTDQQVITWLTEELAALDVPDPTTEATRLLALIDGVALHSLTLPPHTRPAYTRSTLTRYLTALTDAAV
jgi:AcrR family transcriptional regulator